MRTLFPLGVALVLGLAAFTTLGGPALAGTDTEPPVTHAEPGGIQGTNGWWRSNVVVALTCTDNVECLKTEFSLDGSDFAPYEDPFAVSGDGVHTVLARSVDTASNTEATNTLLVKIDTVNPGGAIADPQEGTVSVNDMVLPLPVALPYTVVVGDKTVSAKAGDATSGVGYVEFVVDGVSRATDAEAPYAWLWHAGDEAGGGHTLEVAVCDVAGNCVTDGIHVVTLPTSPDGAQRTAGL